MFLPVHLTKDCPTAIKDSTDITGSLISVLFLYMTEYHENNIHLHLQDNIDLMAEIEDNTIDLIYCDVLYGTGRKFDDYQDLKPKREIIEEHYTPRIKEMHRILKETGSIYLQMDTRINHWVRCIMDDVFDYGNFINEIIWKYSSGGNYKSCFSKHHDTILFYSKSLGKTFNLDDVTVPASIETIKRSHRGNARQKLLTGDHKTNPTDVWLGISTVGNQRRLEMPYPTQKPKALIERIIKASSNEGDLVADFYLGSGTTAVVCKELNRRFIGCDINPKAIEITKQRLLAIN